eukprot:scaffold52738_cov65-Attheya_sp.AAC.5
MMVYTATWARYMDMAEMDQMEWVLPMSPALMPNLSSPITTMATQRQIQRLFLVRKLNFLVIGSYMVLTVDSGLVLGYGDRMHWTMSAQVTMGHI